MLSLRVSAALRLFSLRPGLRFLQALYRFRVIDRQSTYHVTLCSVLQDLY